MRQVNQVNPPKPKWRDDPYNPRRRIFYKSGNSSMLLCKNITPNSAKVLVHSLRDTMSKLGVKLEGNFIIVQ